MANFLPKCLVIASCFLVISLSGCGDIEGELASLTISPSSVTLGISKSQLFTVSGKDNYDFPIDVDPTWRVTGSIGTITSGGLFIAGPTSGEGDVVASYEGKSASASVIVTDKGWVAGRVSDSKGSRVPNLKVYLKGADLSDFTDSSGNYSISDVTAGTYEVWTAEVPSVYRASSKEVTVTGGETEIVDFTILFFTDPPDFTPPEFTP